MSRIGRTTAAAIIVLAMLLAALFLWVGIPLLWLYIASQLVHSSQPSICSGSSWLTVSRCVHVCAIRANATPRVKQAPCGL